MERFNIEKTAPNAFNAMIGLEAYLKTINISETLRSLIKIRASNMNGCTFCINMHVKEAIKKNENINRLFLINTWQDAKEFTDEEKTVLAMTEEITLIHEKGLSESTYQNAKKYFDVDTIAQIIMAIVTINAWNRITISSRVQSN